MRTLTFQARHFRFKAFSQTLEDAPPPADETRVDECVVAFVHFEEHDESADARKRAFKHLLKHLKWLANKRDLKAVVLHSFTHLGGQNASPGFAQELIHDLTERLESTGYAVKTTPFGHFCEWNLDVYGESLAKVWKQL